MIERLTNEDRHAHSRHVQEWVTMMMRFVFISRFIHSLYINWLIWTCPSFRRYATKSLWPTLNVSQLNNTSSFYIRLWNNYSILYFMWDLRRKLNSILIIRFMYIYKMTLHYWLDWKPKRKLFTHIPRQMKNSNVSNYITRTEKICFLNMYNSQISFSSFSACLYKASITHKIYIYA